MDVYGENHNQNSSVSQAETTPAKSETGMVGMVEVEAEKEVRHVGTLQIFKYLFKCIS